MSLADTYQDLIGALSDVDGFRIIDDGPAPAISPGMRGLGVLTLDELTFDETFGRGCDLFWFTLAVFVPMSSPRTQITTLFDLLTDVKSAVEVDTLTVQAMKAAGFGGYTINQASLYGCLVTIEVNAVT